MSKGQLRIWLTITALNVLNVVGQALLENWLLVALFAGVLVMNLYYIYSERENWL